MSSAEEPPSTPRNRYLTRDERLQVQTLSRAGHTQVWIADHLRLSRRQVGYALASDQVTPKHRSGRPPVLSSDQVDELVSYVQQSRATRQMSYLALASGPFQHWEVSEYTIRYALRNRGFTRHIALAKPPLSEANKTARLRWAVAHVGWTYEQWSKILWSDETWVTGGRHRRRWVTRRVGEELDDTCLVDKVRKKRGWMFWGCFSGSTKGPSIFWEKEWGSINKERYCERIVPLVHGWLQLHPNLSFMQDGAPGHSAEYTINELRERGIYPIFWPPFSPDLNPIEAVWNRMKDYIEHHHPDLPAGKQRTYDQLRQIVQEAWNAVSDQTLSSLIESMKERCEAVIAADGGHTKY
jgi:transposase